jgi:two-component system, OmpR family, KDP operon response regulator KdpE
MSLLRHWSSWSTTSRPSSGSTSPATGRVLTHRTILQQIWGPEYGTETQYLRVYASQLRKKLSDDPTTPRLVTEPGVGYRLVEPDGDPSP